MLCMVQDYSSSPNPPFKKSPNIYNHSSIRLNYFFSQNQASPSRLQTTEHTIRCQKAGAPPPKSQSIFVFYLTERIYLNSIKFFFWSCCFKCQLFRPPSVTYSELETYCCFSLVSQDRGRLGSTVDDRGEIDTGGGLTLPRGQPRLIRSRILWEGETEALLNFVQHNFFFSILLEFVQISSLNYCIIKTAFCQKENGVLFISILPNFISRLAI